MKNQDAKMDYHGLTIHVGIDVHKKSWKVGILCDHKIIKTFSQEPEPDQLYTFLKKSYPGANFECAYEAGFCGFWIYEELIAFGMKCKILHPADIPTTDKEKRSKTDKRDCKKIAKCSQDPFAIGIHVPSKQFQYDRSLVRTRARISKDLTRIKNRIRGHLYFFGIPIHLKGHWPKSLITNLQNHADSISDLTLKLLLNQLKEKRNQKLEALRLIRKLSTTSRYNDNVGFLISIPGIGLVTAMCFLTEIDDVKRFKNLDALCSIIGLIPNTNSSGENHRVGRITKRGNAQIKGMIIESAWVAIRSDPGLRLAYQNYCVRMKPNKAIIRIAKKLVNRIRSVLIKRKKYAIISL